MRPAFKIKDLIIITALSLLGAIGLVLWLAVSLPPATAPAFLQEQVMGEWRQSVQPENDATLFHAFIIFACLLQVFLCALWGRRFKALNMFWTCVCSLSFGCLVLLIASYISSRIPFANNDLLNQVFPFFSDMVRPEREMQLYALWVIASVVMQGVLMGLMHPGAGSPVTLATGPRPFFKFSFSDGLVVLLTGAMLYTVDCEFALAGIFLGDQAQHFDSFIGAPAWAALSGNILDVDTVSHYGLGMPVVIGQVAQIFGGGHLGLLKVMMLANLVYFLLWYVLFRSWFKSILLAGAATWCAIRLQMFNTNEFPCVFNYPSSTVMRFWWDILFLGCLWLYLTKAHQRRWIIAAAGIAGMSVFYMSSTGVCLVLTFYAFLAGLFFTQKKTFKSFLNLTGYALLVVATAFLLLLMTQGKHIFSPQFWHDMGDFNKYFLAGFGALPVFEALSVKKYWAFGMGFFIPLVYIWTIIFLGGLIYKGQAKGEAFFVCLLSLYGLGLYHYFIARSSPYGFYTVAIPWVAVMFFWLKETLLKKNVILRAAVAGLAFIMLWTNPQFTAYANIFRAIRHDPSGGLGVLPLPKGGPYFDHTVVHTARIPSANSLGNFEEGLVTENDFKTLQQLKSFVRREFDFSEDARLIGSLTGPDEKVALLSSFDVSILMQAKRRPFFYCFPTFLSRPLTMRSMAVPEIYTMDQFKRTIGQLERDRPSYLFIERIYSKQNLVFANNTHALQLLLLYVHTHYDPMAQGKYLMVLKRR